MTTTRPQQYQRQLLLVLVLFLVGQFALALHSHDLSLHTVDTEECLVCLVSTSDDPAPLTEATVIKLTSQPSLPLPRLNILLFQPRTSLPQSRAPPVS